MVCWNTTRQTSVNANEKHRNKPLECHHLHHTCSLCVRAPRLTPTIEARSPIEDLDIDSILVVWGLGRISTPIIEFMRPTEDLYMDAVLRV